MVSEFSSALCYWIRPEEFPDVCWNAVSGSSLPRCFQCTTNGCFPRSTLGFPLHSLSPQCTCLSNSYWQVLADSFCRGSFVLSEILRLRIIREFPLYDPIKCVTSWTCLRSRSFNYIPVLATMNRRKAVPTGIATGLDIGLSNLSLKMITLSFYSELSVCLQKHMWSVLNWYLRLRKQPCANRHPSCLCCYLHLSSDWRYSLSGL